MRRLIFLYVVVLLASSCRNPLSTNSTPVEASDSPGVLNGSLSTEIPRPGPDILYSTPAHAPQLENSGEWSADPILVSGSTAYRKGEFIYQDWLYDDAGAYNIPIPAVVVPGTAGLGPVGAYTYPSDSRYAGNAADIVEIRLKPLASQLLFRITYNTLIDPKLVATTIILGGAAGTPRQIPHGANASAPADVFVTVHGDVAEIVDAATGAAIKSNTAKVAVDLRRRQVQIWVPYSIFDPRGRSNVRIAAASGLWNVSENRFLIPTIFADATHPGGSGGLLSPPAFFNVAFRMGESRINNPWMESQQAQALATGDISPFFALVDFTRLAAKIDDDSDIPTKGYLQRIFASRFEDAQGRGSDGGLTMPCEAPACVHQLSGQLQPYSVYVPEKTPPASGYGLTLDLHGCFSNYNFALPTGNTGPIRKAQFGERGSGSLVVTVGGRGSCYWYWGQSGAEVFEVWADVAAHYPLDPTYSTITGESMGGYGTNKLAAMFPDLFSRAAPYVPCPSAAAGTPGGKGTYTNLTFPSLRNIPLFTLASVADVVCNYPQELLDTAKIDALGYRYNFWTYPDVHDLVLMTFMDTLKPIADWMGDARVDRNPAHVTYVLNASNNQPDYGLNADHSYWLYNIRLRDNSSNTASFDTVSLGQVDVFSHGFGEGPPDVLPTEISPCLLEGNPSFPPIPCVAQSKDWGPYASAPISDQLDIKATNISAISINVDRARVSCRAVLNIESDGPIDVKLHGRSCP